MKKYIFSLLAAVASLTACNNNDIVPEDNSNPMHQVTIDVATEQGLNTRAGETSADRYVIEFYTDAAYTTVANVFNDGTKNQATSQNGIFSLVLDRTHEYHCLLWADKAGTDVYETTSLKAVTLKSGATPVEAWHGKLKIEPGNESTLSVSLKRGVAKITLKETGNLPAGTLALSFEQNTKFDVSTAAIATGDTKVTRTETITVAETTGTKDAPVKINTNDIFVLASVADAEMPTLTFKMGSEEAFEIPNVPLKANYNTNITGHYTKLNGTTFTVTCDDTQWENSDNEVTLPNIIWATGNLVANADKSGCKIGNPTDNGLYFQFGSLIGWSETGDPTIVVKPTDCTVTSWDDRWRAGFPVIENTEKGTGDPCKYYLKGTWRLPTLNEYKALFNNTADDTGYANTGGWSYTSESISNSALDLTFPVSGSRAYGELADAGAGLYWSSLADTESDYKGYYLYFNDSKVGFYRLNGSYGMPIRCVRPNASN